MASDDPPLPESLLPYDRWTRDALSLVVLRALGHAAREGLPGDHHFYITFKTGYPGVVIPDRLRAKYPDEMTIVLQHQFSNLKVDEGTQMISVQLSFSGIPATLSIPLAAISAFADPQVRFGLNFDVEMPLGDLPPPEGEDPPERGDAGEIVSLDAFRRRPRE